MIFRYNQGRVLSFFRLRRARFLRALYFFFSVTRQVFEGLTKCFVQSLFRGLVVNFQLLQASYQLQTHGLSAVLNAIETENTEVTHLGWTPT